MNLINKNLKAPKVSIFCMVYNHEPFIRECLEGFLMQKCNFDYEIVLGEDCSTDNSREIILEYANKFPGKFKLLLHEKNIGAAQNQKIVFENCTGKYIALCEGDDYWTDPLKLQKQVDFLEANLDFSMCFHSVKIIGSIKDFSYFFKIPTKSIIMIEDIIVDHYIPTCSLVFRKKFLPKVFPNWFQFSIVGDIPLEILLAVNGPVKYIDKKMGAYRKHDGGITFNKERRKNVRVGLIKLYKSLNKHLNYKYWLLFFVVINKHRLGILKDRLGMSSNNE